MNLSAKSDVLDEVDRVDFFPVSDPSEGLFVGLGIHDVLVCWWLRRDDRPDLYNIPHLNASRINYFAFLEKTLDRIANWLFRAPPPPPNPPLWHVE